MINLLAPEDKKVLVGEYRRHKLVVGGVLWFFVSSAAVIIFTSLYIVLYFDQREVVLNLAKIKQEYEAVASDVSERSITTVNQQAELLLSPASLLPTVLLDKLVSLRPTGVLISNIAYKPAGEEIIVNLNGQANSRQDFLRLLSNLQSESTFTTVDSPVDNLIRERNVQFSLVIHLKS